MFERFRRGRLLPWLLMLSMIGNVIDCVRVDPRSPSVLQVAQRRRRRHRTGGRYGMSSSGRQS